MEVTKDRESGSWSRLPVWLAQPIISWSRRRVCRDCDGGWRRDKLPTATASSRRRSVPLISVRQATRQSRTILLAVMFSLALMGASVLGRYVMSCDKCGPNWRRVIVYGQVRFWQRPGPRYDGNPSHDDCVTATSDRLRLCCLLLSCSTLAKRFLSLALTNIYSHKSVNCKI